MRFQVGDMVRIAVVTTANDIDCVGLVAEVIEAGLVFNTSDFTFTEYELDYGSEKWTYCADDWQLQPINPPAEPVSLTRIEEVSV